MERRELVVIGAGPAGLSAAIEAASCGMDTIVFDENMRPGGQLFKQIHKFFGSKEHKAKHRGFRIGEELIQDARAAGAEVLLNTVVMGIFPYKELTVMHKDHISHLKADNIIIATGATENALPFSGWTLPGVMGAGAAQTMMNLHGIKPGNRILMVGSGNVGLVVSMQLMQAGCEVAAIIDAAPIIGGYGVHAAKVARCGVPFYLSHTIISAEGDGCVQKVTIAEVDSNWQPIPGSKKTLDVDTICLAVGLSPMYHLAATAGCELCDNPKLGGFVPVVDKYGSTTVPGIFAAGDVSGIEEASSAMIKGRITGAAAAARAGYITDLEERSEEYFRSLDMLRQGMFCQKNKGRTDIVTTDEGFALSQSLLHRGYLTEDEAKIFPGFVSGTQPGFHPVIECTQNIPCNPCGTACKNGCITLENNIICLPHVNKDAKCSACGICISACPGQAIFLVNENYDPKHAAISIPYEFLPLPEPGSKGTALDRSGAPVCEAEVVDVRNLQVYDHTPILTIAIPKGFETNVRFFQSREVYK